MSLATEANTGGIVAAMEARRAAEDARTTARLDWWVKVAGRCYGCGAHVSDEVAAAHPGVCAGCTKTRKLAPLPVPPEFDAHASAPPPARPAATRLAIVPASPEEEAMPCSICSAKGHNARGHAKAVETKPAEDHDDAPARASGASRGKSKPAARRGSFDVESATVESLVTTIEECRIELIRRKDELQDRLDQVAKAIGASP